MKSKWQYVFFLLILSISSASAQTGELSITAQYLKSQVEAGDSDAIRAAGDSGDLTLIPYLKQLASDGKARNNSNSSAFQAHIALAKLGDDKALQQILADIDADNPDVQDKAMKKLSIVGGDEAFKKFYQLLDDTASRENPDCRKNTRKFAENSEDKNCGFCYDVIFFPKSSMAIFFLSQMVNNPPTKRFVIGTEKNVSIWKEWFKKINLLFIKNDIRMLLEVDVSKSG